MSNFIFRAAENAGEEPEVTSEQIQEILNSIAERTPTPQYWKGDVVSYRGNPAPARIIGIQFRLTPEPVYVLEGGGVIFESEIIRVLPKPPGNSPEEVIAWLTR